MSKATTVMEMQICEGFMKNLPFAQFVAEGKKSTRIIPHPEHPIDVIPLCFEGQLIVKKLTVNDLTTVVNGQIKNINNAISELNQKLFSLTGEAMEVTNHNYQTVQDLIQAIEQARAKKQKAVAA